MSCGCYGLWGLIECAVGGGAGPGGGSGFVYAVDAQSAIGVVSSKSFQDVNGNVLQSFTSSNASAEIRLRSSFPLVSVNSGPDVSLPLVGGVYEGLVPVSLSAGQQTVSITSKDPDGLEAASDTVLATLTAPAQLLTLQFSGGYPGGQTELKAGDTFTLTGTSDVPIDGIQLADSGVGNGALITFGDTTSFSVSVTIPNRGISPQALALLAQPRDAASGALGALRSTNESGSGIDGANTVVLNNRAPSISFGAITYPGGQGALKNSESATIAFSSADLNEVVFDSPTSEISITDPAVIEATKTVARLAGDINETTSNLRAVATRNANGATTTAQAVIVIQNSAPVVSLSLPAARLRSGGNDGTSAQDYVLTLTSNQRLASAPSLSTDQGGQRGSFVGGFSGGPSTWTRTIRVDETVPDEKGTFAFEGLFATNLSGLTQSAIGSGTPYTLGGFVARTLTFSAFSSTVNIGTSVEDFSKLQANLFTATNQNALRQPIGTSPSVTNGFTIGPMPPEPPPSTILIWLDTSAVNSNSSGTAQITDVREVA